MVLASDDYSGSSLHEAILVSKDRHCNGLTIAIKVPPLTYLVWDMQWLESYLSNTFYAIEFIGGNAVTRYEFFYYFC